MTHLTQTEQLKQVQTHLGLRDFKKAVTTLCHSPLVSLPAIDLLLRHPELPTITSALDTYVQQCKSIGQLKHPLESALCEACFRGQKEKVKSLIALGALKNNSHSQAYSFFFANENCSDFGFAIPLALYHSGLPISQAQTSFLSLHQLSEENHQKAFSFLLSLGADPYSLLPLQSHLVKYSHSFQENFSTPSRRASAFHILAAAGPHSVFDLLLSKKPPNEEELLRKDDLQRSVLFWSGLHLNRVSLMKLKPHFERIAKLQYIDESDQYGGTLLTQTLSSSEPPLTYMHQKPALDYGSLPFLKHLLKDWFASANPALKATRFQHFPLYLAVIHDPSTEALHFLLEAGATPHIAFADETALHTAIRTHSFEHATMLIKAGADPFSTNKDGKTVFDQITKIIHDTTDHSVIHRQAERFLAFFEQETLLKATAMNQYPPIENNASTRKLSL